MSSNEINEKAPIQEAEVFINILEITDLGAAPRQPTNTWLPIRKSTSPTAFRIISSIASGLELTLPLIIIGINGYPYVVDPELRISLLMAVANFAAWVGFGDLLLLGGERH